MLSKLNLKNKAENQKMNPKFTVIIITYNQEKLIKRAIDSVLCQKDMVFEIVISDDCSTDNTWEVICEYQRNYPEIIKPYRNPANLGIFGNIESTYDKANGDVIFNLSGDDALCHGLFEEALNLIKKYQIDYVNEAFTLYFDYMAISPDGKEIVYRNNLVNKYNNPVSLKIRQLICNRTTGFSRNVFNKFYPVRKDIGLMADGLIDIQVQLFSEKNYYSSFIGSKYYSKIGVSVTTNPAAMLNSYILSLEQLKIDIKNLTRSDLSWLIYMQKRIKFEISPSIRNYFLYFAYFFGILFTFYGYSFIKREVRILLGNTYKFINYRRKR